MTIFQRSRPCSLAATIASLAGQSEDVLICDGSTWRYKNKLGQAIE